MERDSFVGGKSPWAAFRSHGDPFPLSPSWIESCLEDAGVSFPQRGVWTAKALNCLALHGANSDFDALLRGVTPNLTQKAVASRLLECFKEAGPEPENMDGPSALKELVSCKDLYHEEPANLAPYEFSKIKVLNSELNPRPLREMVPRFVRGIIDRFDTMIEKSAEEVASSNPCNIKPYWDPKLRSSPRELKKLVVRLSQIGLVSFRTGIKEQIGIFCVRKKTPEFHRLIIDARRANHAHRVPPVTRLATPRSFLDIQMHSRGEGQPLGYGLEADVSDCFYNYLCDETASWFGIPCPLTCRQWKALGWPGGKIYSDETKLFYEPDDDKILFPVFRGLCMGWAWALFLANEAVAFAVCDRIEKPLSEVRDRLPAPDFGPEAITGVYVDNISIMAPTPEAVNRARHRIEERFKLDGIPLTWSSDSPQEVLETIGVVFDFRRGVARIKSRRLWRTFLAGRELLRRRRVSGKHLEIWVGHVTSLALLFPGMLSCFFHIYRFLQENRARRAEVWVEVRREIQLALGLLWLCRAEMTFNPIRQVDIGDSSTDAFAMMTTWASTQEVKEACRFREGWRFRPLPESLRCAVSESSGDKLIHALDSLQSEHHGPIGDQELKPTSCFGAGVSTQYASWLLESQDPSSWLRTSSVASQLKASSTRRVVVEAPALMQPLSEDLVRADRFSLLWRRRWRGKGGHITLKEGRVALSSLKRSCRVVGLHGKVKLTCTDNLSCLCAFEKGRTGDFKLNQLCRVAAAYQGACGIKWRLRHIETKRNKADHDSRFTQHSSDWGNRRLVHDRGKKNPTPARFVPPGSTALPSSPLPAQTHSVGTATDGRAVPGGCGNQKKGDCRDRLKDKIQSQRKPTSVGIEILHQKDLVPDPYIKGLNQRAHPYSQDQMHSLIVITHP